MKMDTAELRRLVSRMRAIALSIAALAITAGCATLAAADPNALWQIVHFDCAPAARKTGHTGLCARVDLDRHFAILKDRSGVAQHLLIPTERVSGVESPLLLAAGAQNYWADAWDARSFVEHALQHAGRKPLADDQLGLEINSAYRRSQEQLHIHIDCMRPDAIAALARHRADRPGQWIWDTIGGTRYRIMRMPGPDFSFNPFDLVAHDKPDPDLMALQTILVTGAGPSAKRDGWLILNSATDVDHGTGSAEGLLDHRCAVAPPGPE